MRGIAVLFWTPAFAGVSGRLRDRLTTLSAWEFAAFTRRNGNGRHPRAFIGRDRPGVSSSSIRRSRRWHTHEDGIHDGAARLRRDPIGRETRGITGHEAALLGRIASGCGRSAELDERVMSYGSYHEIVPRRVGNWTPRDTSEIDINDERELAYWCHELRISIGDLIWLVGKYGTASDRIRAMVK